MRIRSINRSLNHFATTTMRGAHRVGSALRPKRKPTLRQRIIEQAALGFALTAGGIVMSLIFFGLGGWTLLLTIAQ